MVEACRTVAFRYLRDKIKRRIDLDTTVQSSDRQRGPFFFFTHLSATVSRHQLGSQACQGRLAVALGATAVHSKSIVSTKYASVLCRGPQARRGRFLGYNSSLSRPHHSR
jgi:hypothetical protein